MKEVTKRSTISIEVGLDEKNVPCEMRWKAQDGKNKYEPCKAMLLSLFDEKNLDTVKLDLWTKSMQVNEMDRFMFQTLRGLAQTYFQATQNSDLANQFQSFVDFFGKSTGLLSNTDSK